MNTAKGALLAAGRIKEVGRGRISNDNHIWLMAQVAKGEKFSDYPKAGAKVVVSTTEAKPAFVKAPAPSESEGIASLRPMRYPDEKAWQAKPVGPTVYNLATFGMREVCKCGNSLVACYCDQPVIFGHVKVEVVPK